MPCFTQALTRQPVGEVGIRLGGTNDACDKRAQAREQVARRFADRRRRRRPKLLDVLRKVSCSCGTCARGLRSRGRHAAQESLRA